MPKKITYGTTIHFQKREQYFIAKKKIKSLAVTGVISLSPYTDGNTNLFTPGCHRDIVSSL